MQACDAWIRNYSSIILFFLIQKVDPTYNPVDFNPMKKISYAFSLLSTLEMFEYPIRNSSNNGAKSEKATDASPGVESCSPNDGGNVLAGEEEYMKQRLSDIAEDDEEVMLAVPEEHQFVSEKNFQSSATNSSQGYVMEDCQSHLKIAPHVLDKQFIEEEKHAVVSAFPDYVTEQSFAEDKLNFQKHDYASRCDGKVSDDRNQDMKSEATKNSVQHTEGKRHFSDDYIQAEDLVHHLSSLQSHACEGSICTETVAFNHEIDKGAEQSKPTSINTDQSNSEMYVQLDTCEFTPSSVNERKSLSPSSSTDTVFRLRSHSQTELNHSDYIPSTSSASTSGYGSEGVPSSDCYTLSTSSYVTDASLSPHKTSCGYVSESYVLSKHGSLASQCNTSRKPQFGTSGRTNRGYITDPGMCDPPSLAPAGSNGDSDNLTQSLEPAALTISSQKHSQRHKCHEATVDSPMTTAGNVDSVLNDDHTTPCTVSTNEKAAQHTDGYVPYPTYIETMHPLAEETIKQLV